MLWHTEPVFSFCLHPPQKLLEGGHQGQEQIQQVLAETVQLVHQTVGRGAGGLIAPGPLPRAGAEGARLVGVRAVAGAPLVAVAPMGGAGGAAVRAGTGVLGAVLRFVLVVLQITFHHLLIPPGARTVPEEEGVEVGVGIRAGGVPGQKPVEPDPVHNIQHDKQLKKAPGIDWTNMLLGAAGNKLSMTGSGLVLMTKNSMTSEFALVKKVTRNARENTIKLDQILEHNQIYVEKEDYDFVWNYITSRCKKAKIR